MSRPSPLSRHPIPRSRIRAAAIAAGVVGAVAGGAIALDGMAHPESGPIADSGPLLAGGVVALVVFALLFLLVLLVLAQMQTGVEWRKRGGRPDPFTRDG